MLFEEKGLGLLSNEMGFFLLSNGLTLSNFLNKLLRLGIDEEVLKVNQIWAVRGSCARGSCCPSRKLKQLARSSFPKKH